MSYNAACTHARYHNARGRQLDQDYEVFPKKVLGEGCSGLVVMAKGRTDGRMYALKRIHKLKVQPKVLKQLTAEVEIYLMLDHPHIAALRDVYETDSEIALLTECCEGGELYSRLSSSGTYAEADAANATHQMLLAVGYLHAHHVVHRDLKLENFLYESSDPNSLLKLIDFGFAKIWDPSTLMMASCGSIAYVSPDVLKGEGYTNKCDLWSLGVIVFMLLVGYPPFHGSEKDMRANILCANVDWSHKSRWRKVSEDAVDFVKCLLVRDPLQRMDVGEALSHRWIKSRHSDGRPVLDKEGRTGSERRDAEALRALRHYADASRVRRAVLQMLAQDASVGSIQQGSRSVSFYEEDLKELAPEETKELRDIFLALDSTGEGTISLSEPWHVTTRSSNHPKSARWKIPVNCAYGRREGRGKPLIRTPWIQIFGPRPVRPVNEVIGSLFEVLDANGDEQVYYSDFLAATLDVRKQIRQEAVLSAFNRLDADGSGSISPEDLRQVIGETFEGVNVELLVREADAACKGELTFQDFLSLLDSTDASVSPKARQKAGIQASFYLQPNVVP
ncbi:Calcium-dependent protein kinase 2 (PfCDPK2) [Durusdinium trenchii]|uniref:Calcium-dependent protein kinase 2 (PfCDPK2) n=1 Tax=Durusdinium trenchii TaxID=1381693 RepID=A0ABP0KE71_9DINO